MNKLDDYLEDSVNNYLHPSEIANILKELGEDEFNSYIKRLPKEILGDVALELPDRYLGDIISDVSTEDLCIAVKELESDDQTDLLQDIEEIDTEAAKEVFDRLGKDDQSEIKRLKKYGEVQAGAYMQTENFIADVNEKVNVCIDRFKELKNAKELENVHTLFITQIDGKLLYSIDLEDLLTFDFTKTFKDVIDSHQKDFTPKIASDTENIEDVVKYFEEFDLSVIPVTDVMGTLVGRITSDDVYDIINHQATEQIYNLAGVDDDAEEDKDVFEAGKKRSIWLFINLFTAIIASLVIGLFESTLQSYVALAVLMPIVASMGGNAGTQALTVVVRQLALGDITLKDAYRIIKKEIFISIWNGLLFAVVMGFIASVWFNKGMLGVVIALSMIINLVAAGFFGAAVPLLLKKFKFDPAIGSSVLLTTVTDIVGFFSFLGLAKAILL